MKFDVTAIFFNSSINDATATPPWCISIGQGKDKKINQGIPGIQDFIDGLIYKSVLDRNQVKLTSGSNKNEYLIISKFDKIFVNGLLLQNTSMIVLLVREHTLSHEGRLRISIPPYAEFDDGTNKFTNRQSYQAISTSLGCGNLNGGGCWFVSDVLVKNQEELHLECIIVDPNNPKVYSSSQERSADWVKRVMSHEKHLNLLNNNILLEKGIFINSIKTKPFLLLAGISGTGKSRIVRELAFKSCPPYLRDKVGTTPGNYCMIEVKPNWHDSTELLGYHSNLVGKYQFKKFIKFLIKAKMFPDVPFFLCLDEMNLAPVEQYFAEILSILETRKHPKDENTKVPDMNVITTGVLVEPEHFRNLTSEMRSFKNIETGARPSNKLTDWEIYLKLFEIFDKVIPESDYVPEEIKNSYDLINTGLTLPDNVIIIGTVNMDDTTHQFSRKVIDRALTIEMNGGNLKEIFGGSKNLEYTENPAEQQKWQESFKQRYVSADEVLDIHSKYAKDIRDIIPQRLEQINEALKGTPFEVSYRVLNELIIMVGVLLDDKSDEDTFNDIVNSAINNILLMKILPRIEGDSEMFDIDKETEGKGKYSNRLEWLKDLAPEIHSKSIPSEKSVETEGESYENNIEDKEEHKSSETYQNDIPSAKAKIQEMINRLNRQDFTRFWP